MSSQKELSRRNFLRLGAAGAAAIAFGGYGLLRETGKAQAEDFIHTELAPVHPYHLTRENLVSDETGTTFTKDLSQGDILLIVAQELSYGNKNYTVDSAANKTIVHAFLANTDIKGLQYKLPPGVSLFQVIERSKRQGIDTIIDMEEGALVLLGQTRNAGNCTPTGCDETRLVEHVLTQVNDSSINFIQGRDEWVSRDVEVPSDFNPANIEHYSNSAENINMQNGITNITVDRFWRGSINIVKAKEFKMGGISYKAEGVNDVLIASSVSEATFDRGLRYSVPANTPLMQERLSVGSTDYRADALRAGQVYAWEAFQSAQNIDNVRLLCLGTEQDLTGLTLFNDKTYNKATTRAITPTPTPSTTPKPENTASPTVAHTASPTTSPTAEATASATPKPPEPTATKTPEPTATLTPEKPIIQIPAELTQNTNTYPNTDLGFERNKETGETVLPVNMKKGDILIVTTNNMKLQGNEYSSDPVNNPDKTLVFSVVAGTDINSGVRLGLEKGNTAWIVLESSKRTKDNELIEDMQRGGQVQVTRTREAGNCTPTGCSAAEFNGFRATEVNGVVKLEHVVNRIYTKEEVLPKDLGNNIKYHEESAQSMSVTSEGKLLTRMSLKQNDIIVLQSPKVEIENKNYANEFPSGNTVVSALAKVDTGVEVRVPLGVEKACIVRHHTTSAALDEKREDALRAAQTKVVETLSEGSKIVLMKVIEMDYSLLGTRRTEETANRYYDNINNKIRPFKTRTYLPIVQR